MAFDSAEHDEEMANELYLEGLIASVEAEPENSDVWMELGAHYVNISKMDEALQAFQRAASIAPNNCIPHEWIGLITARNGNPEKGLKTLKTALNLSEIDEDRSRILTGTALVLNDQYREEEALALLVQAMTLDKSNESAFQIFALISNPDTILRNHYRKDNNPRGEDCDDPW